MSDFVGYIQDLGDALQGTMAENAQDDFVKNAYDALHDENIYRLFDNATLDEIVSDDRIADIQHGTMFSDLQLKIYRGNDFYIELLFWLDGATTIHDHAFEGAFAILRGCAVQSSFKFMCSEAISDGFQLGDGTLIETDLMVARDVNRIDAGSGFIHSTFHLAQPSISIVIRTDGNSRTTSQFEYDLPFVAINTDAIDP